MRRWLKFTADFLPDVCNLAVLIQDISQTDRNSIDVTTDLHWYRIGIISTWQIVRLLFHSRFTRIDWNEYQKRDCTRRTDRLGNSYG